MKEVRDRIASVKNTSKITEVRTARTHASDILYGTQQCVCSNVTSRLFLVQAMKLVAAAKVRRAQAAVVNARPFAENLVKVGRWGGSSAMQINGHANCACRTTAQRARSAVHERAPSICANAIWRVIAYACAPCPALMTSGALRREPKDASGRRGLPALHRALRKDRSSRRHHKRSRTLRWIQQLHPQAGQ